MNKKAIATPGGAAVKATATASVEGIKNLLREYIANVSGKAVKEHWAMMPEGTMAEMDAALAKSLESSRNKARAITGGVAGAGLLGGAALAARPEEQQSFKDKILSKLSSDRSMNKQAIIGSVIRGAKEMGMTSDEKRRTRGVQAKAYGKKHLGGRIGSALWDPAQTARMDVAQNVGTMPGLQAGEGRIAELARLLKSTLGLDKRSAYNQGFVSKCAERGVDPKSIM